MLCQHLNYFKKFTELFHFFFKMVGSIGQAYRDPQRPSQILYARSKIIQPFRVQRFKMGE